MSNAMSMNGSAGEREAILQWFETDFKETAKRTTQTSRADDGKVNYSFSVINNSGYDFDRFSFKVRILNKADGSEIGSATIRTGDWKNGDKKNFKSRIAIPEGVRSISFVMYSESVDYAGRPAGQTASPVRGSGMKDIGDMITGADGSGGVFGELFGTGGMPETKTTTTTRTTTHADGSVTKETTTTRTTVPRSSAQRSSGQRNASRGPASADSRPQGQVRRGQQPSQFARRKNEKKLNKLRLGKSSGAVALAVFGVLLALCALADTNTAQEIIGYLASGGVFMAAGAGMKYHHAKRGKAIRAYEANINYNGNTSIDDLCAYVGKSPEKVIDDLQRMISEGFFPGAYVEVQNRLLVMTENGVPLESPEQSAAANKKAKRRAAREKGVVPESIEDLITMTDDPEIKSKLKDLRALQIRIDKRIQERPDLADQVTVFREKYFPEVVRLTDEYNEKIADLGKYSQQKSGADSGRPEFDLDPNSLDKQAAEIKVQLISLIDSVYEASENLLERLHEDDIMDISTDIKMLQTTLASKGLLDSDFDL